MDRMTRCLLSLSLGLGGQGLILGEPASLLPSPASSSRQSSHENQEGFELIGRPAPDWEITDWIGSPALSLASLRGKVVLVRWFAGASCPYCSATAPALNRLHRDFSRRGLVIIGLYHHKGPGEADLASVRELVRRFGFEFPVGVDQDWRTLRKWWLDGHERKFTSVSFLLDPQGIIRQVHPGGVLAMGTAEYEAMRSKIEELLPS